MHLGVFWFTFLSFQWLTIHSSSFHCVEFLAAFSLCRGSALTAPFNNIAKLAIATQILPHKRSLNLLRKKKSRLPKGKIQIRTSFQKLMWYTVPVFILALFKILEELEHPMNYCAYHMKETVNSCLLWLSEEEHVPHLKVLLLLEACSCYTSKLTTKPRTLDPCKWTNNMDELWE